MEDGRWRYRDAFRYLVYDEKMIVRFAGRSSTQSTVIPPNDNCKCGRIDLVHSPSGHLRTMRGIRHTGCLASFAQVMPALFSARKVRANCFSSPDNQSDM